jgi:hypothetical protein
LSWRGVEWVCCCIERVQWPGQLARLANCNWKYYSTSNIVIVMPQAASEASIRTNIVTSPAVMGGCYSCSWEGVSHMRV